MKQIYAGAVACTLFILLSCNGSNSSGTAASSVDSSSTSTSTTTHQPSLAEQSTQNMKAVYRGIETGDVSAMDSFCSKDLIDYATPKGKVKGLDSVKSMLADIHNHISDLKLSVVASGTDGDYVLTLARLTGKTKDASMGMPANTPLDDTSVDVVKLVNGKAVVHWSYEKPRMMAPAAGKKGHMAGKM